MEFMQTKLEREDFLADVMMEVTESKNKPKKLEDGGIYVDPNFELSEDAKMGNKLAQDDRAWNQFFGNVN
jgi:hypothetical protein